MESLRRMMRGRREQVIQPHGEKKELLHLQKFHRSEAAWNTPDDVDLLTVKKATDFGAFRTLHPRIRIYLDNCGFGPIARIGGMKVDSALITGLVERWRPETHTFHLSVGEATMTLQDVNVITGLKVDGVPLTCGRLDNVDWKQLMFELLGQVPSDEHLEGNTLKLKWLSDHFQNLEDHPSDETVKQYTRAVMLRLLGGTVFANKSADNVHLMLLPLLRDLDSPNGVKGYAWGAAMLSYLYGELCKATNPRCKQIGGYVQFVQIWAYERIIPLCPRMRGYNSDLPPDGPVCLKWKNHRLDKTRIVHNNLTAIRITLDNQRENEMIWEPYNNILLNLPHCCLEGENVWRSVVPILFMYNVEMHQPDRCLRQFGMNQPIPRPPKNIDPYHTVDMRGNSSTNWEKRLESVIAIWGERHNPERIAGEGPLEGPLHNQSEYMQWYFKNTRRWILPRGGSHSAVADGLEHLYHMPNIEDDTVRAMAASMLTALDEQQRMPATFDPQHAPLSVALPYFDDPIQETQRRRRHLRERRTRIPSPPPPVGLQQIPHARMVEMYGDASCSHPYDMHGPSSSQFGGDQFTNQFVPPPQPPVYGTPGASSSQFEMDQYTTQFFPPPQPTVYGTPDMSSSPIGMDLNLSQSDIDIAPGFFTPVQNIVPSYNPDKWTDHEGGSGSSTMNPTEFLYNIDQGNVDSSFVNVLQSDGLIGSNIRCDYCGCSQNYANEVPQGHRFPSRGANPTFCRQCNHPHRTYNH